MRDSPETGRLRAYATLGVLGQPEVAQHVAATEVIVVQVHERRDGSGYPQGLRGEQIRDLAGIIGLADTYEALVAALPQPART